MVQHYARAAPPMSALPPLHNMRMSMVQTEKQASMAQGQGQNNTLKYDPILSAARVSSVIYRAELQGGMGDGKTMK